tara:strand:+ start:1153 stop:2073 length:921 start_codon:yes stop_codon:yes gene_type:complete
MPNKCKFTENILKLSVDKTNLKQAVSEWIFIRKYKDSRQETPCICQRKITHIYYLYNKKNKKTIAAGGTCFTKFKEKEKKVPTRISDIIKKNESKYEDITDIDIYCKKILEDIYRIYVAALNDTNKICDIIKLIREINEIDDLDNICKEACTKIRNTLCLKSDFKQIKNYSILSNHLGKVCNITTNKYKDAFKQLQNFKYILKQRSESVMIKYVNLIITDNRTHIKNFFAPFKRLYHEIDELNNIKNHFHKLTILFLKSFCKKVKTIKRDEQQRNREQRNRERSNSDIPGYRNLIQNLQRNNNTFE